MISCRKLQQKLLCLWQIERVLIFHKHENQNTVKVSYQVKLIQTVCWERKLCINKVELGFEKNYVLTLYQAY